MPRSSTTVTQKGLLESTLCVTVIIWQQYFCPSNSRIVILMSWTPTTMKVFFSCIRINDVIYPNTWTDAEEEDVLYVTIHFINLDRISKLIKNLLLYMLCRHTVTIIIMTSIHNIHQHDLSHHHQRAFSAEWEMTLQCNCWPLTTTIKYSTIRLIFSFLTRKVND